MYMATYVQTSLKYVFPRLLASNLKFCYATSPECHQIYFSIHIQNKN